MGERALATPFICSLLARVWAERPEGPGFNRATKAGVEDPYHSAEGRSEAAGEATKLPSSTPPLKPRGGESNREACVSTTPKLFFAKNGQNSSCQYPHPPQKSQNPRQHWRFLSKILCTSIPANPLFLKQIGRTNPLHHPDVIHLHQTKSRLKPG